MTSTAGPSTSAKGTTPDMRCIAHLDMDCFYAQVEAVRLGVDCRTTPFVCVQWGSFIAVNYPARALGVQRFRQTPGEVQRANPELRMGHVATYAMGELDYGYPPSPAIQTHKVSLEPYRHASRQIFAILRSEPGVEVGKAGIDEAFIDVTAAAQRELEGLRAGSGGAALDALTDVLAPSTRLIADRREEMDAWLAQHGTSLAAVFDAPMRALLRGECGHGVDGSRGFCVDASDADYAARCLLLCAASRVVLRLRQRIYAELHFDCSAGIAHNRVLAKCISATHKPNQQTLLLPDRAASALFDLPLSRLRGFGGKFGAAVSAVCGGATVVRELWCVPMAQLHALDGSAVEVSEEDEDDDGGGGGDHRGHAEHRKGGRATAASVAEYTYFRIRGVNGDAVRDPALPRAMEASKIFHPSCTTWSAARQWMAPLAGELWHRFRHYEHHYLREGRSIVVSISTYVSAGAAAQGQRARSYRRHTPLPPDVEVNAALLADVGGSELCRLMAEVTNTPLAVLTIPPSGTGGEKEESSAVAMPPLRVIGLSVSGLRLRVVGEAAAAPQRSLKDMFSSLVATQEGRQEITKTTTPPRGKRSRSTSAEASVSSGSSVVLLDDNTAGVEGERGESLRGKTTATLLKAAPAPPLPPRGTLDAFFCSQRVHCPAVSMAEDGAADVPGSSSAPVCRSTSIIEISSGDEGEN